MYQLLNQQTEEVRGAIYQDFFRKLWKIVTSKFWEIKKAAPDPMAILIEMIFEKLVEKNRVKSKPIKNPIYTIFLATIFPYARLAKSVIKNVIG